MAIIPKPVPIVPISKRTKKLHPLTKILRDFERQYTIAQESNNVSMIEVLKLHIISIKQKMVALKIVPTNSMFINVNNFTTEYITERCEEIITGISVKKSIKNLVTLKSSITLSYKVHSENIEQEVCDNLKTIVDVHITNIKLDRQDDMINELQKELTDIMGRINPDYEESPF